MSNTAASPTTTASASTHTSRAHRPHVLIAGGGIGGMAAALGLLRRGIDVDIYEQANELREVGAGVQISANGNRALQGLGVLDELKALSCEASGKEIRHWNSGQTWKLFDLGAESVERYGYPYLTVYRPDLLAVLTAAVQRLKPDALHLKSRVSDLALADDHVTLTLDDGRTVRGDVLIGGDGVHSRVRQILFGDDKPHFTGIIAWRAVVPMQRLPAHMARLVATNWVGPGGHVVHYPVHEGKMMNVVGARERDDWQVESWSTQGTLEECLNDFAGWNDDVHALFRGSDTLFKWALMGREPMQCWTRGRATLLGDACHPTLPFLAQGAVHAIEDGYILARCLEAFDDVPHALQRYELARRERTSRMVRGSNENATRFHNPELAHKEGAQAYIDREWQPDRVRERYDWLFTYDVDTAAI